MTLPDIRSLVPHSGTMVLLDRVVALADETLCAELVIKPDTLFCDGQGVGAWVGVEYMAQAVAAFAGYEARVRGRPVKVGFLLGSRRYQSHRPSFPVGSTLHIHVQRALQGENGLGAFECRIDALEDAGVMTVATASITVFQPDNVNQFLQEISE